MLVFCCSFSVAHTLSPAENADGRTLTLRAFLFFCFFGVGVLCRSGLAAGLHMTSLPCGRVSDDGLPERERSASEGESARASPGS